MSIVIGLTIAMFLCQLIIDNVLFRYFILVISIVLFIMVALKNKTKVLAVFRDAKK